MSGDWLTYQEAATRLGIKVDSVKKRAARRLWQRTTGNDGRTRVLVPSDSPGPVSVDIPPDMPPGHGDVSVPDDTREKLAASEARAAVLAAQVEDLQRERDRLLSILETRPIAPEQGFWSKLFGRR